MRRLSLTYNSPIWPCDTCGGFERFTRDRKCVVCGEIRGEKVGGERKEKNSLERIVERLATTPGAINDLEESDCIEGYNDGRANEPLPGGNRSDSYAHGWWMGMRDGGHRPFHQIDGVIGKSFLENENLKEPKGRISTGGKP